MESVADTSLNSELDRSARWTSGKLFRRRVARFWREQWRVWRTALDWTVWLYLIIPGFWLLGGVYVDLWHHTPQWLAELPVWVGERVALIVALAGRLRTFAEDADVLFLLQRKSWGKSLIARGMGYSVVILALGAAVVYGLLFPFLVGMHGMSVGLVALLWLFTTLWAFIGAVWRNLIEGRYRGWRKLLWKMVSTIVLAATYILPLVFFGTNRVALLVPIAIGAVAAALFVRLKLRARDTFDSDVQLEYRARLSSTQLLLRGVMDRPPRLRLNTPLVLRRSNRLFKKFDGAVLLSEAAIKTFLRRISLLRVWLIFLGAALVAVVATPVWLKLLIVAVMPILLGRWVQSHWRNVAEEPFVAQFDWTDDALRQSAERTRLWLVSPAVALIGLVAGLQIYGPLGLLLAVPAVGLWYAVNKFLTSLTMLQPRKKGGGRT